MVKTVFFLMNAAFAMAIVDWVVSSQNLFRISLICLEFLQIYRTQYPIFYRFSIQTEWHSFNQSSTPYVLYYSLGNVTGFRGCRMCGLSLFWCTHWIHKFLVAALSRSCYNSCFYLTNWLLITLLPPPIVSTVVCRDPWPKYRTARRGLLWPSFWA
jgi:hypothetical protein